jgi:glucose 1-dehydrogenase
MTVQADVTDPEQVQQMLTEIEAQLGTPQIVVASAGASIRHDIFETTADHLRWTFESIVIGTFNVLQVAAKRLVAKRLTGSFLVMGSIHARVPFANALAYNAAKAALHQLTSTFAAELLQHNIRVNVLVPGLTDTPGERRFRTEEELLLVAEQMPMGRMATVEEIGQLAAYLVSSENAYMTGSVVSADGGLEVSLGLAG